MVGAAGLGHCIKQDTVSCSSIEAEYIAGAEAAREITAMRTFLHADSDSVQADSASDRRLDRDPHGDGRQQPSATQPHLCQGSLPARTGSERRSLAIAWIPPELQLADILTRALPRTAIHAAQSPNYVMRA